MLGGPPPHQGYCLIMQLAQPMSIAVASVGRAAVLHVQHLGRSGTNLLMQVHGTLPSPCPAPACPQVLQFNPLVIISLLSKAPELLALPHQKEQQQIQTGFRQYLQARRHFSADPGGSDKRSEVELEMTRDQLAQKVASVRQEQLQGEWPKHVIGIVRLLLSCLHAWGADRDLDRDLEGRVGLIRPIRPISFGLASRGGALSLVLPGWVSRRSAAMPPASPQSSKMAQTTPLSRLPFVDLASIQDQRWGLSQLLTTQHLLTVVSVANTLMNYIRGAQLLALAASRPAGDSFSEDSEEEDTPDEGTKVGGACKGSTYILSDSSLPLPRTT